MRRALPLLALAAALCAAPVRSARAAGDAPDPAAVRGAIDRGAAWLRGRLAEAASGESWHDPGELVVLALAHAGAKRDDPSLSKAIERLDRTEPRFTYRTAVLALALAELDSRRHRTRIAHAAQWLVDLQGTAGDWGYPGGAAPGTRRPDGAAAAAPPLVPASPGARTGESPARVALTRRARPAAERALPGDFSNTQFAILGLHAAREAGVDAPRETWTAALAYLRKMQRADGGWGYAIGGQPDAASYASLTAAGVASVALCLHATGAKDVGADPAVRRALAWLRRNVEIGRNVGVEGSAVIGSPSTWQFAHLWSLERAARFLGPAAAEGLAGWERGASWLLAKQEKDGSWRDEAAPAGAPAYLRTADTCFAILFLSRATKPLTGS